VWGPAAGHPAGILGTGHVILLAIEIFVRPAGPAGALADVTPPGLAPGRTGGGVRFLLGAARHAPVL